MPDTETDLHTLGCHEEQLDALFYGLVYPGCTCKPGEPKEHKAWDPWEGGKQINE